MAYEDPLVSNSSANNAVQIRLINPRGRPTRSKAIKFCPQPKSIVSQLLSNITKNLNNKAETSCTPVEDDESFTSLSPAETALVNIDYFERNDQGAINGLGDTNNSEDYPALSSNQIGDESHEDSIKKPKNKNVKHNLRIARKLPKRNGRIKSKTYSDDLPLLSTARSNDNQEVDCEHCCGHAGCTYKSNLLTNLTKHKRVHTNERPYMCDQCTFRSNYVNSLKAHKQIHSRERRYCCHHCGYRCNSTSNLKKHFLHKHKALTRL